MGERIYRFVFETLMASAGSWMVFMNVHWGLTAIALFLVFACGVRFGMELTDVAYNGWRKGR